ncbi:MAG: hypothetical protein LLG04_12940 [Parachlamydia sp.]|nr:hypothetical protein [Parachlamydia sp.]
MQPSEQNPRIESIEGVQRMLPNICPDALARMRDYNETAKLDLSLLNTVEIIYNQLRVQNTANLSVAFNRFLRTDCAVYLAQKVRDLQSYEDKFARTVADMQLEDRDRIVVLAEKIDDLTFVSQFVSANRLTQRQHACLDSIAQMENELRELQQHIHGSEGEHARSLRIILEIQRHLGELKAALAQEMFDRLPEQINKLRSTLSLSR